MITVRLPWPPKELSPNARVHWAQKAGKAKRYRQDACVLTLCQINRAGINWIESYALHLTFCPPDRRRRDLDNMLASIKPGIDGIADAIQVDDQHFSLTLKRGEPTKGGEVIAVITQGEQHD